VGLVRITKQLAVNPFAEHQRLGAAVAGGDQLKGATAVGLGGGGDAGGHV
jgi:hypothetical protein